MNALDRVPQVPQDYANHLIYGGVLGAAVALAAVALVQTPAPTAWLIGTAASGGVCGAKKVYDYIKAGESVAMCVGKTMVTAALPACFYLGTFLRG